MPQAKFELTREPEFREWLAHSHRFTSRVVSNTCSRLRRLCSTINFDAAGDATDLAALLLRSRAYAAMTMSVRSQLKRAGELYLEFSKEQKQRKK
jgi:hypothetical protein